MQTAPHLGALSLSANCEPAAAAAAADAAAAAAAAADAEMRSIDELCEVDQGFSDSSTRHENNTNASV